VYRAQTARAGGTWNSFITVADPDGTLVPAVEDKPDEIVEAYSVNKIGVSTAVLDKIDRGLLSDERARVGTKAGWDADGRNEAGIMFDTTGRPVLTYAMFAHGQADPDNFGATHPAVEARAVMGRRFLDAIDRLYGPVTVKAMPSRRYHPSNGG
jgi:hypothetical protein